jgi:hypothetical protein
VLAAAVFGLSGAAAMFLPPDLPEPWASISGWVIIAAAAGATSAVAYAVGVRGKHVWYAAGLGVLSVFATPAVVLGTLFAIGLIIDGVAP